MPNRPGAGRTSQAITRKVIETYGDVCHLCHRPGATTRDHLIPYSLGGTDDLGNLRPAHRRCNSIRGNRTLNGFGCRVTVVIGPPAAGKSTYVAEHADPLKDVVIDLDVIARALMVQTLDDRTHVYPQHVRHVAIGARQAAIDRATRLVNGTHVWLIHAIPNADQMEQYRFLRYDIVTIDPGRHIVEKRAAETRPSYMQKGVARWYSTWGKAHTPPPTQQTSQPTPELAGAWW